jgi:hypothetical protein
MGHAMGHKTGERMLDEYLARADRRRRIEQFDE